MKKAERNQRDGANQPPLHIRTVWANDVLGAVAEQEREEKKELSLEESKDEESSDRISDAIQGFPSYPFARII